MFYRTVPLNLFCNNKVSFKTNNTIDNSPINTKKKVSLVHKSKFINVVVLPVTLFIWDNVVGELNILLKKINLTKQR